MQWAGPTAGAEGMDYYGYSGNGLLRVQWEGSTAGAVGRVYCGCSGKGLLRGQKGPRDGLCGGQWVVQRGPQIWSLRGL